MSARLWLESVERELSRNKLPRQEVARLVAELSDHLADLMESLSAAGTFPARGTASVFSLTNLTEEDMSMDASVAESLGSPEEIAETAVREFRMRKNQLSRSRLAAFCTFVLLPLPALCLAWTAAITGLTLVGEVLEQLGIPDPSAHGEVTGLQVLVVYLVLHAVTLAPAAGVAAAFGRLAGKTALRWRWGLAACLLVGVGTGLVTIQATFSDLPGKSTMVFGLGIGSAFVTLKALGQLVIPLVTGLLVLWRSAPPADHATAV